MSTSRSSQLLVACFVLLFAAVSLRATLWQLAKNAIFSTWFFLAKSRKIYFVRYNFVWLVLTVIFSYFVGYHVVRSVWIWIYSRHKNKESNEDEKLKVLIPDDSITSGRNHALNSSEEVPASPSMEDILHVMLKNIRLFEYLESSSFTKILTQISEITLSSGEEILLNGNNNLFLLIKGTAGIESDASVAQPHKSLNNGPSAIHLKNIYKGDMIGDLFRLLHLVLNGNLNAYHNPFPIKIVAKAGPIKFLAMSFDSFIDSKHNLIHVVLSRFQKSTFDTISKYLKISGPFAHVDFDMTRNYYDEETANIFLESVVIPDASSADQSTKTSTALKFDILQADTEISARVIDVASYYFSYLLLSREGPESLPSPTCGNEDSIEKSVNDLTYLIASSSNNYSTASVKSFAELFDPSTLSNCQQSAKLLFFREGELLIKSSTKIQGLYLILEGSVKVMSEDGTEQETFGSGRFVGLGSVLVFEKTPFKAIAVRDTIVALFRFDSVRKIFDNAKDCYCDLVAKFMSLLPHIVKFADVIIDWKYCSSGQKILGFGEVVDKIGLIIHGRLRAIYESGAPKKSYSVQDFTYGSSFGEIECLTMEKSLASVYAVRDTEVSFITLEVIEFISSFGPHIPFLISKKVARKALLHKRVHFNSSYNVGYNHIVPASNIKIIALIPATKDIPIAEFALSMYREMCTFDTCKIISSEKVIDTLGNSAFNTLGQLKLQRWLSEVEETYRILLLIGDARNSNWNSWIVRQADCIFLVASEFSTDIAEICDVDRLLQNKSTARRELIVLHSFKFPLPDLDVTAKILQSRPCLSNQHHIYFPSLNVPADLLFKYDDLFKKNVFSNIRHRIYKRKKRYSPDSTVDSSTEDIRRLCRIILGRAIGLVLGGGGAKGMAHIGIIRALEEIGIKPDLIGGTSMGAFFGACYARDPNHLSLYGPAKSFSMRMSSTWRRLMDITFPYTSLFTGHAFNRSIWDEFRDTRIEDLWLNYFCVSTNITKCCLEVHQQGYLWRFARASMSLAGYLPPLIEHGDMLVDGGYLNNLPADIMHRLGAHTIISVDVGSEYDRNAVDGGDAVNGWTVIFKKLLGIKTNMPTMGEIQARLTFVSSADKLQEVIEMPNSIYLRPPIEKYTSMDFAKYSQIIETGYEYAKEQIKKWEKDGTLDHLRLLGPQNSKPKRIRRNSI